MILPVSVLILAKNEEKTIRFCISSLIKHVQEIIVCDTGSSDRTVRVVESFGAKVIRMRIKNDFSVVRNSMITQAKAKWILNLDADCRIAEKDVSKLGSLLLSDDRTDVYSLPLRSYSNQFGLITSWFPSRGQYAKEERFSRSYGYYLYYRPSLFRNIPEIRYTFPVHESLTPAIKKHGLRVRKIEIPIHHFEFFKGMEHHYKKHRFYANLEKEIIRRWPNWNHAYYCLIHDMLLYERDLSEAKQLAQKLTKLNPRRALFWTSRGIIEMEMGNLYTAEDFIKKAIDLKKTPDNLCLLGWVYLKRKEYHKSEAVFKKTLNKKQHHPLALNLLGVAKERQGFLIQALRYFKKASRIHPGYSDPLFNAGLVYERLGKLAEARNSYRKADQIDRSSKMEFVGIKKT